MSDYACNYCSRCQDVGGLCKRHFESDCPYTLFETLEAADSNAIPNVKYLMREIYEKLNAISKIHPDLEEVANGMRCDIDGRFSFDDYEEYQDLLGAEHVAAVLNTVTTEIPDYAFHPDFRIKSVIIPDGVTRLGVAAFSYCRGLKRVIMPDSITEIGADCFECCSSIEKIKLSPNIQIIGPWAFNGCFHLKSITIPDGVKVIHRGTFADCERLESIVIPDSVESIEAHAFYGCINLKDIKFPENASVSPDVYSEW